MHQPQSLAAATWREAQIHPRLMALTLHCSSSPIPARTEEFPDFRLSSRLSFVPQPDVPPPGLAALSQHSSPWLPLLEHPHSIRNALELSHLPALQGPCPQRGGSQSLASSLSWPSACCSGTGVSAAENPCDSFSLNYNHLYQGQLLLSLFFLSTQQGVTELSHLPSLSTTY